VVVLEFKCFWKQEKQLNQELLLKEIQLKLIQTQLQVDQLFNQSQQEQMKSTEQPSHVSTRTPATLMSTPSQDPIGKLIPN